MNPLADAYMGRDILCTKAALHSQPSAGIRLQSGCFTVCNVSVTRTVSLLPLAILKIFPRE
ncbi:hypothetical protein EAG14_21495 [Acidovorax sp. 1608163]|nr:hypothetical protein EAG14_21495 [Acidovorax sp. 1608163]